MPEVAKYSDDIDLARSAVFDETEIYRYSLLRVDKLRKVERKISFLMLNPSTADHTKEDPTIKRCMTWAFRNGFSHVEIVNLFALRATDPQVMKAHPSPIGPRNDDYIRAAADSSEVMVCAWGAHGKHLDRAASVRKLLSDKELWCFVVNADGSPKHPLYLKRDLPLVRYC